MAPRTLLISKRNSAYQILESLATNRQKRNRTRTFFVEGVQPINMALTNRWQFGALVYESGSTPSRWAKDVLSRAPTAERYEIAPDLFRALSRKDEPSELLAIIRMPDDSLERIRVGADLLVVLVDRPGKLRQRRPRRRSAEVAMSDTSSRSSARRESRVNYD